MFPAWLGCIVVLPLVILVPLVILLLPPWVALLPFVCAVAVRYPKPTIADVTTVSIAMISTNCIACIILSDNKPIYINKYIKINFGVQGPIFALNVSIFIKIFLFFLIKCGRKLTRMIIS